MNRHILSLFIMGFTVAAFAKTADAAQITLPSIYADNMVFQTDRPIVVSGHVSSTLSEVTIEVAGRRVTVKPRLFGDWTATLDPISEAGGSYTLSISAEGEVAHQLENITFGDVWLCGGQSNMAWDMTTINDSAAEIAGADYPDIRLMEVALITDSKPLDDVKRLSQKWTPCSPTAVRGFSAVGYLFGRELHQETGRPIGLIQSAWGGSRIEPWIPSTALQENSYADNVAGRNFNTAQHKPSLCYNAMIHGLSPLGLKGVIWYQGESNQSQPEEYRSLHESLITSWRELWKQPDLPFYLVQLANYAPGLNWELLREAQTQTLAVPNTGMAVTIDIGASNDIHPRNKQGTAHRLAAIALAKTYGRDLVYSGPLFKSASTNGHDVTLHFDHLGSGLMGAHGPNNLREFEVQSLSGQWSKANAIIAGDTVVVPGTLFRTQPQAVRYGWESDPEVSLFNKEGFPAVPFRLEALELTYDSWKDQLVGTARLPNHDANGDGRSNLMDYASAEKPPTIDTLADRSRVLTFHQRASITDVSVLLEQSSDFVEWSETWALDQPDSSSLTWSQDRAWGAMITDRYSVTLPPAAASASYYRIRYRLRP